MPPTDGVSMLSELVDLFLEGAPQRITQIEQAMADAEQLSFHAHALKSMSLNLGAKRIVELARQLEELSRNSTLEPVPLIVKELRSALEQTKTHLLAIRDT
jgi:HPt (histidine-containing phosphotransfer) domain-containing protein